MAARQAISGGTTGDGKDITIKGFNVCEKVAVRSGCSAFSDLINAAAGALLAGKAAPAAAFDLAVMRKMMR